MLAESARESQRAMAEAPKRSETRAAAAAERSVARAVAAWQARAEKAQEARVRREQERQRQLLELVSKTLNQKVPEFVEDIVSDQMENAVVPAMSAAGSTSVAQGMAAAREAELSSAAIGGAVAQRLGPVLAKSLSKAIQLSIAPVLTTALGKLPEAASKAAHEPMMSAFEASFQKTLIPAYERASKTMFEQINQTFRKGIAASERRRQQELQRVEAVLPQLAAAAQQGADTFASVSRAAQQLG